MLQETVRISHGQSVRSQRSMGVSVRALHHWDETGLVRPSQRSDAGYRLYSETDIMRIQQVLVYRQTGMSLADIKAVLDEPGADALTRPAPSARAGARTDLPPAAQAPAPSTW